jgi:hypothetical protein
MTPVIAQTVVRALLLLALAGAAPAGAQQSERFDRFELHYSVVNSTFITPEIASEYGITRGDDRAFINVAVREHRDDGTAQTVAVELQGESWDLTGRRDRFDFIEIREGTAVYYIGEFKFLNREWRHFEVRFTAEGEAPQNFRFKRQMYREQR